MDLSSLTIVLNHLLHTASGQLKYLFQVLQDCAGGYLDVGVC